MFRREKPIPVVWLVDDRPENRESFERNHGSEFAVELFSEPDQVLSALREGRVPDALICDVYFYKDAAKREEIEQIVSEHAQRLRREVARFEPGAAEEGIALMQSVSDRFHGKPPFPVFAYTSKGPYLLQTESFDKIEELDARWLFKNKYSAQAERRWIRQEIESFAERRDWRRKAWAVAWRAGLITAILGAVLGVIFDRLAGHFGL